MEEIAFKLAFVGAAGIAAQWLAWRLHLPAIVLLLAAGFAAGPATGFIVPAEDFGKVYQPAVGLAVAVILFEGGLTLNFREIRGTSTAVRRIILIAGPLTGIGTALVAHYFAGMKWPVSAILGAILVVTGPTVIMPLLRSAKLKSRPASLLRWEAIVNDPIGALFAVGAFEAFLVFHGAHEAENLVLALLVAFAFATVGGWLAGRFIAWSFIRGHVPEFLKAPILMAAVFAMFAVSNLILDESGLLTVTVMGVTLANSRLASLGDLRRFKETVTVLLVSALFIVLTAALDWSTIRSLDFSAIIFVLLLLLVIRPIAIAIATIGSGLTWQERLLTAWIAPRGIVAVAVASLFGALLTEYGLADGQRMVAFAFAVVVASIVLHGFSLLPLARLLDLQSSDTPGILLVGGSRWVTAFAAKLKENEVHVTIADTNWNHLREARQADIPTYYGEPLSEHAHHGLNRNSFVALVATTDNDAYNALVCTDFGPEIGRSHVYQVGETEEQSERTGYNFTLGGRPFLKPGLSHEDLRDRFAAGWTFQATRLSEGYTYNDYMKERPEGARIVLWRKPDGSLVFRSNAQGAEPEREDVVISFAPPREPGNRSADKRRKAKQAKAAEDTAQ